MPTPQQPVFEPATPPQSGFVKMSQAPDLAAKQKALNGAKKPAFIPNAIKEQSKRSQIYIFNVGPKPQEGNGASYGRVMIPACPAGREYSDPFVVPGLPYEQYQHEVGRLSADFHGEEGGIVDPGWDWACQAIMGFTDSKGHWEGKFLHPSNSLEKFGVGLSRTWPPAKEDVALARKKLLTEYSKLVTQANEAHAIGKFSAVGTPDHFVAAHALGKTAKECRWMEFSALSEQETKPTCPKCRKPYELGTVEHDCGFILDMKQYNEWVKEGRIAGVAQK